MLVMYSSVQLHGIVHCSMGMQNVHMPAATALAYNCIASALLYAAFVHNHCASDFC
jgi:hypothetical protein